MATLTAIRAAIKTTVHAAVPELHTYDTVPDVVNLPALVVMPDPAVTADFTVAMGRGTDTWNLLLYVLCPNAEASLGQKALDEYVSGAGDKSVRQAIFHARDLGLAGCDAHVDRCSGYGGRFEVAQADHIGAVLHLVVHTSGTA